MQHDGYKCLIKVRDHQYNMITANLEKSRDAKL